MISNVKYTDNKLLIFRKKLFTAYTFMIYLLSSIIILASSNHYNFHGVAYFFTVAFGIGMLMQALFSLMFIVLNKPYLVIDNSGVKVNYPLISRFVKWSDIKSVKRNKRNGVCIYSLSSLIPVNFWLPLSIKYNQFATFLEQVNEKIRSGDVLAGETMFEMLESSMLAERNK